jgi:hypothetical protein
MYLDALPDLRVTIEEMMAEGDKVAVRRSYKGTHRGEMLGIPATGKQLRVGGISIFRLAQGRIAEHWEQLDRLALMQQLAWSRYRVRARPDRLLGSRSADIGSDHLRHRVRLAVLRPRLVRVVLQLHE